MITKHPDNPKIFIDAGDPGLSFGEFVFRSRSRQVTKKISKYGVSFFQKEGNSVSCLTEKVSAPMRNGCLSFEFAGFIRHRIAPCHLDQRCRTIIRRGISHKSQYQSVGQRTCSPYGIQIGLVFALLVKACQGTARRILLLFIQLQTIQGVKNSPKQSICKLK